MANDHRLEELKIALPRETWWEVIDALGDRRETLEELADYYENQPDMEDNEEQNAINLSQVNTAIEVINAALGKHEGV